MSSLEEQKIGNCRNKKLQKVIFQVPYSSSGKFFTGSQILGLAE